MGVHTAHDRDSNVAIMYCSTTDWAFGPVFTDDKEHDADERVEAFLRWLRTTDKVYEGGLRDGDPRSLTDSGLASAFSDWRGQEAEQWAREEAEERARWEE